MAIECSVCLELLPPHQVISLTCGCKYCLGCMDRVVKLATNREAHYPPRCCQWPIPADTMFVALPQQVVEEFMAAKRVWDSGNRTYCSNKTCGKFIDPIHIVSGEASCPCRTKTCSQCKNAHHDGYCSRVDERATAWSFAREQGWKICHKCGYIIELESGSYHIICLCRHEFCYSCGAAWKTCNCKVFEGGPEVQASQYAASQSQHEPAGQLQSEPEGIPDFALWERLQKHCEHPGQFHRVMLRRGGRCKMCNIWVHKFLLTCRECHLEVCEQCRHEMNHFGKSKSPRKD
ncbi:hypothetical protein EJ06DRAFT_570529 [Trichodelitschia bisporula]|uniref:RBR-type E3 ubiquitin transferase n=1 Tax=Trichodelitschia bisporula TaxID=703511 RepID=A0A6G1HJI4_9PEZI|nr:hypothetical protein EJ06DRAFT_570529 [Trichodelitschia bisporula]